MSGLLIHEQQLLRVASYEVSWLAGNAIAAACRMTKPDVFYEILGNYKNIVNQFYLTDLATRCQRAPVRSPHKLIFKQLMHHFVYCCVVYGVS